MIGLESPFPVVVIIYHLSDFSNTSGSDLSQYLFQTLAILLIGLDLLCKFTSTTYHLIHGRVAPNMLISSRWSFISSKPVWNEDTEEIWTSDSLLEFMYWSEFNSMICFVFLFFIFILPQITWSSPLVMLALFCQYFL